MKKVILGLIFCVSTILNANQTVTSVKVETDPVIDGKGGDKVWEKAKWTKTRDKVANIDISFKTVYNSENIAFLVKFPDETKNIAHKTLIWNKNTKQYDISNKREDIFIFKWNIKSKKIDLTLTANNSYKADIWYWKANRTDPSGYADDKLQTYDLVKKKKSKAIFSKNGQLFFLTRTGDKGKSAYKQELYFEYIKDEMAFYTKREPKGSRADIKAKGSYENGEWTIEFLRKLDTTHSEDDLIFDTSKHYIFGVSRFEISGMTINPKYEQPNYNAGEINEIFELKFEK